MVAFPSQFSISPFAPKGRSQLLLQWLVPTKGRADVGRDRKRKTKESSRTHQSMDILNRWIVGLSYGRLRIIISK